MDDGYLKAFYYGSVLLTWLIATASFLWLKGSLAQIARVAGDRGLTATVRRVLYPGLLIVAFAGFSSTSIRGCLDASTYAQIAADHPRIVRTTLAQQSDVLVAVAGFSLALGFLVVLGLVGNRDR